MGAVDTWKPLENRIQSGLKDGQFVNAVYTRLASGPPRLSQIGGIQAASTLTNTAPQTIVYGLGLIQNIGLTSSTNFAQVFEVGSNRSLYIAGRTVHGLNFGSVYYHGPSLMRRVYAYYKDEEGPVTVPPLFPNVGAENMINEHDVIIPPGFDNLFWNLGSDLFWQPIGFLLYQADSNEDAVGAIYLEGAVVPNWSMGTDSQGVIVQEQVSVNFERSMPVAVSSTVTV